MVAGLRVEGDQADPFDRGGRAGQGGDGDAGGLAGRARAARRGAGRTLAAVNPLDAVAAAFSAWVTPDLPLYGLDHDRADFAP